MVRILTYRYNSKLTSNNRASSYAAQRPNDQHSLMEDHILDNSKIESYLGIDKREGLIAIARRLLQSTVLHPCSLICLLTTSQT